MPHCERASEASAEEKLERGGEDWAKMKKIEASMSKVGCKDGSETWVSNKNIDAFLQSVDGSTAKRDVGDYEVQVRRSVASPPQPPPPPPPQPLQPQPGQSRASTEIVRGTAGAARPDVGRVHSAGIIQEGYLEKKGGGTTRFIGNTAFKQRYWQLFNRGVLVYFEKPGGVQKGTITLSGAVVAALPGDGEFSVGNEDAVYRTFHLRAPTNTAREMWLICLESAGCEVKWE